MRSGRPGPLRVYPVTLEGRLVAMILMLLGIGLFSAITATATSYLLSTRPHEGGEAGGLVEGLARLTDLREQGSLTDEEFTRAKQRLLR
jgi:hypothetical protein